MNNFLLSILKSSELRFIIAGIQAALFMALGIILRKNLLKIAQQKQSFKILISIAAGALYGLCTSLGIVLAVKLIGATGWTNSYWYAIGAGLVTGFSIAIGEVFLKLYSNRKKYNEKEKP